MDYPGLRQYKSYKDELYIKGLAIQIYYRRKHNVLGCCVYVKLEKKYVALPRVAAGTVQGGAGIKDATTTTRKRSWRRRRSRRRIRIRRAGARRCIGQGGCTVRPPLVAWLPVRGKLYTQPRAMKYRYKRCIT